MPDILARTEYHFASLAPDLVYRAWLDPDIVRRWMTRNLDATSENSAVTSIEIDPVVGGGYRFAGLTSPLYRPRARPEDQAPRNARLRMALGSSPRAALCLWRG